MRPAAREIDLFYSVISKEILLGRGGYTIAFQENLQKAEPFIPSPLMGES
jgi:hypothetical protein